MLTIAVDAMGGDTAPKAEVEGAIRAVSELDLRVILVGQEDVVRQELAKHSGTDSLPIEILHADEVVTMEDAERHHIMDALDASHWVVGGPGGAASMLGMKRSTLHSRMQKLGIMRRYVGTR